MACKTLGVMPCRLTLSAYCLFVIIITSGLVRPDHRTTSPVLRWVPHSVARSPYEQRGGSYALQ
jgi:hypothetical protein